MDGNVVLDTASAIRKGVGGGGGRFLDSSSRNHYWLQSTEYNLHFIALCTSQNGHNALNATSVCAQQEPRGWKWEASECMQVT